MKIHGDLCKSREILLIDPPYVICTDSHKSFSKFLYVNVLCVQCHLRPKFCPQVTQSTSDTGRRTRNPRFSVNCLKLRASRENEALTTPFLPSCAHARSSPKQREHSP